MTWNTPLFISNSLVYTSVATPTKWEKSCFFIFFIFQTSYCISHHVTHICLHFQKTTAVKPVLRGHSKRRQKIGFKTKGEHSAILSTFIKLPFVFETHVLSIFEWPLNIELFLKPPFFNQEWRKFIFGVKMSRFCHLLRNIIMNIIT